MATPNVSEIIATTLENRRGKIADNVSKNNAVFYKLSKKGNNNTVDGGRVIYEELNFQENPNGGWYSGADQLPMASADMMSAAEYAWKQYAVGVVISGLEERQNSGREQKIKLITGRVKTSEATMQNALAAGLWSDGSGSGGRQLVGLASAVPVTPTTGIYGNIDRSNATWAFWRPYKAATGGVAASATILGFLNTAWVNLVRGTDHPDLVLADNNVYSQYMAALQPLQRFTDPDLAQLGFTSLKYMAADMVLDGGVGGFATTQTAIFLNTDYAFLRSHKDCNMVPLDPSNRSPFNQDLKGQILAWMGAFTLSNSQLQGRVTFA